MDPKKLMRASQTLGARIARRFFHARGDNSEVHLSETELAAICALSAESAFKAADGDLVLLALPKGLRNG